MKSATMLFFLFGLVAFVALPARAQFYGHDMNAYSHSRESGIDPLTQHFSDWMRLNTTVELLQRKVEEDRRRRELQERQWRRGENNMITTPEHLLDSYFGRRSFNKR